MSYLEMPLPENLLGLPINSMPRFSTMIVVAKSGDEGINRNWVHPLRRFQLPEAVTEVEDIEAALAHWLNAGGPASSFPFQDPLDFSSSGLEDANKSLPVTATDQFIATTDGFGYTFQLQKAYTISGFTYYRPIILPQDTTTVLGMQPGGSGPVYSPGSVPGGSGGPYTITGPTRPGGTFTVSPIPIAGIKITGGFLFDVEVRWEGDDSFDNIMHSFETTGAAAINLVEKRFC